MIVLNSQAPGASFRHSIWRYGRRSRAALVFVALATMSSACSGGSREELDRDRKASEPASVENRKAVVEKQGVPPPPQRAPGTTAIVQGTGEVPPQLLEIFRDDLARRALVKPETITVVSATEQQWPDGAMGCPQPGQVYTQAIIPGYRVVLKAGSDRYAYHSDLRGNFIVCSSGMSFPPVKEQIKSPPPAE